MSDFAGPAMREGWSNATLGDLARLEIGRTPPRSDPRYWTVDLERPFCTIADMTSEFIRHTREGVTARAESEGRAKRIPAGTLLMSFKLTLGRIGFAAIDLFPNEAIVAISPDEQRATGRFLALALGAADLSAISGRAAKGRTLNRESLSSLVIDLPPLEEQRRIVDLISSLDATITATDRAVAKAEQARRAVLADLLAPPRAAAELGTAGGLPTSSTPEGWTSGSLDDLGDYLNGRAFKPGDFTPTGLPVIRIKQFLDPLAEMDYFDGEGREEHLAEDGDIIFSWSGTLAVGIWNRGPAWVNQHLFKVEPKAGVDRQWLPLAIEHRIPELKKRTHGSTMRHITRAELRAVRTGIPPLDEQRRIVQIVSTLDDEIAALTATAVAARAARAAILSELLSGEHQIPPSYDRLLEAA
jgi:hypothetical protein